MTGLLEIDPHKETKLKCSKFLKQYINLTKKELDLEHFEVKEFYGLPKIHKNKVNLDFNFS